MTRTNTGEYNTSWLIKTSPVLLECVESPLFCFSKLANNPEAMLKFHSEMGGKFMPLKGSGSTFYKRAGAALLLRDTTERLRVCGKLIRARPSEVRELVAKALDEEDKEIAERQAAVDAALAGT